jgi:hypothetical protein
MMLDDDLSLFTLSLFAVAILAAVLNLLLAKVWPAPYVPIITDLPEPLEETDRTHWIFGDYFGFKFRFRFAEKDDLRQFSKMSGEDPAIYHANPGLNRNLLYATWYKENPRTFMFLDVKKPHELSWSCAAISIVLPLSRGGFDGLWAGTLEVKDLNHSHIVTVGARPSAILIDTLIANPAYRNRNAAMVFSLSVVHASRFWVPEGRKKIDYLIEPDHAKLPNLLPEMGFEGPHEIKREHQLFKFTYPPVRSRLSEMAKETTFRLVENHRKASKWQIYS